MDELVTDMHAHGPGDFFEMFAAPLPIGVFAELLGLTDSGAGRVTLPPLSLRVYRLETK